MAAFVPSLSSLPTGRHHATPSLPCSHRQQLPVATVPRRCQPVMLQAGSAEQQQAGPAEQRRAFDQRMNRMCNEVVKTILRGSAEDVAALRDRLVDASADFVTPSAAASLSRVALAPTDVAGGVGESAPSAGAVGEASAAGSPAAPADAGVIFHSCVVSLLDHTLSPAVPSLTGPYARAFEGMVRLVEDAGWQITAPVMKITG